MKKQQPPRGLFLGIEGGGTRTLALLANGLGKALQRVKAGPANLQFLTDAQLCAHFRSIARRLPWPDAVGVGLAGAWSEPDRERIRRAAAKVWAGVPCSAANDLEIALCASSRTAADAVVPSILVVSGTGSACYGKSESGTAVKVGGWGHLLGDKGSGYEIGLRALKASVFYFDRDAKWPALGRRVLAALQLNEPYDLVAWIQSATKADVAGLAPEVFSAWSRKDKIASDIIEAAAASLARDAAACARRITRNGTRVKFVLAGSVLLKQTAFAAKVRREILRLWPNGTVAAMERESVWGAVEMARELRAAVPPRPTKFFGGTATLTLPRSTQPSPTERQNPRSMHLDHLPLKKAIGLMLREEAAIPAKFLQQSAKIERIIKEIVKAFRSGGRLFYVGAGTSGRLGVLDASECPPTFRTPPEMVQGLIAGGEIALRRSVEGAEDDVDAGARAIQFRGVGARDVVIGIAASGTTPFVWGALAEAKKEGAQTVLICFNPYLKIPKKILPSIILAVDLGPEALTGSTRLKCGTATKLLLNMFTTLSMVKLGKVRGNLMIDLHPANEKLRVRATRIVQQLTGANAEEAQEALVKKQWVIADAIAWLKR